MLKKVTELKMRRRSSRRRLRLEGAHISKNILVSMVGNDTAHAVWDTLDRAYVTQSKAKSGTTNYKFKPSRKATSQFVNT